MVADSGRQKRLLELFPALGQSNTGGIKVQLEILEVGG
jgi:hypothetical protein